MSTPAATRIGDADVGHCSGMTRAKGSPTVFVNNIPWSRQGDVNTTHLFPAPPICLPHAAPITTGSTTVFLDTGMTHGALKMGGSKDGGKGKGAGRVGDAITGCTSVAAGSPNVFCGGEPPTIKPATEFGLEFDEKTV
jgi:uncharacterized Zn-binding protein involved in type VI secretion